MSIPVTILEVLEELVRANPSWSQNLSQDEAMARVLEAKASTVVQDTNSLIPPPPPDDAVGTGVVTVSTPAVSQ